MPASYSSVENDTIDYIVWKYYGTQNARAVEQVLDANPHLARNAVVLPAGVDVLLPDIDLTPTATAVRLWT